MYLLALTQEPPSPQAGVQTRIVVPRRSAQQGELWSWDVVVDRKVDIRPMSLRAKSPKE